jgi:hypothetical protein
VRVRNYPSSLATRGPPPPFIGQGGGGLQSCSTALSATYGGMEHSVVELIVVLANLISGGRRGESCARPGAGSRVAVLELLLGRHLYAGLRARLTEDQRLHSGWRGDALLIWVPTVLGMTLQCSGWRHSDEDGRIGPEVTEGTRFAGLTSRRRPGRARGRWP